MEPSQDIQKELTAELEKVSKVYGGGPGVDMTKFPAIKFPEAEVDPVAFEK